MNNDIDRQEEAHWRVTKEGERGLPIPEEVRNNRALFRSYKEGLMTHGSELHIAEKHEGVRVTEKQWDNAYALKRSVDAIEIIGRNRDSLDLMERSYPKADHQRHADISTARGMLNSLESSVFDRKTDVALSANPNALTLVKQSIHAVERAGTTVHHELSHQWQSKRTHELQVGHDKSQ
ncbi:hypothetical protein KWH19_21055 [Xanthomonas campestris pv. pennamericanum]|uniref:hypothetical protein n=1 Tax=Xanthomonas euvesicatoria TaxID=456327 RepID=UPI001C46D1E0|nr:hypothetical protein [Xanthomonas euvesicatoria]MBV6812164.1 hypothetical protein [Xanthomonas campestris pv. pennamericanum]MCC4625705.1 hypothetical protein [Xanthomonas campestris pv. nigromaculans]